MFIFVEAHIDPLNSNNPLVVQDSIVFDFNGNIQDVKLVAFGQDVNLINGQIIDSNATWTSAKPYLVYNSMLVDTLITLNIQSGTKIYFHKDSRLYVKGTLVASGSLDEPILFRNDRLEHWYDDMPGQWAGIYFIAGSKDNVLNYCEIKNAIIGVQADTVVNSNPTITISNTKILNMNAVGIYGQGANILSWNNVIANCGQFALALTIGGSYKFYHCTVYNSWDYSNRQTPSLLINNYYQDIYGTYQVRPLTEASFTNCIIYGSQENEIVFDKFSTGTFNYKFTNCLLKIADTTNFSNISHWENNLINHNPGIKNPDIDDFSLDTMAYVKDKGSMNIAPYYNDIKNVYRFSFGQYPDIGAYERQDP